MTRVVTGRKAEACSTSKNTRTVYVLQDMIDCTDGSTLQATGGGGVEQIFLGTRHAGGIDTDTWVTAGKIADIAGAEFKNKVIEVSLLANYGICDNKPTLLSFAWLEEELVCL